MIDIIDTLRITFGRSCAWSHPCEWTESNRYISVSLSRCIKSSSYLSSFSSTLTTYKKNKWMFCWFFRDNNLLWQMSSQWGSQKLFQGLVPHEFAAYLSVSDLFLTQLIMVILSKSCKPGNLESYNSLKFNFTNIRGLRSNFVECKSFLELSYHDILAPCETNADD